MSNAFTGSIPAWEHRHVQTEPVDSQLLPFDPTVFATHIPAIVDEALGTQVVTSPVTLSSISQNHARSYEVGNAASVTALWQDKQGNSYTSLSLKGNNFSTPDIFRSATAPSGFIPKGLQEDDALLRVLRASAVLRGLSIPTEWIVAVTEPQVIAYGSKGLYPQTLYKQQLLLEKLPLQPLQEAGAIAKAIENMSFFITARCMEINDRPLDFLRDDTAEAAQARLNKIYTVYNLTHRKDPDFMPLDINKPGDAEQYFTEILPTLRASNLAKLHNAGLVHCFPVEGNVTALGGIIDLDSVRGVPLGIGDKPVTPQDMIEDIRICFEDDGDSYITVLEKVGTLGVINSSWADLKQAYSKNFWQAYARERKNMTPIEELVLLCHTQQPSNAFHAMAPEMRERFDELVSMLPAVGEALAADVSRTWEKIKHEYFNTDLFAMIAVDEILLGSLRKEDSMEDTAEFLIDSGLRTLFRLASQLTFETVGELKDETPLYIKEFLATHELSSSNAAALVSTWVSILVSEHYEQLLEGIRDDLDTYLPPHILLYQRTAETLSIACREPFGLYSPADEESKALKEMDGLYYGKPFAVHSGVSYSEFLESLKQPDTLIKAVEFSSDSDEPEDLAKMEVGQIVSDAQDIDVHSIARFGDYKYGHYVSYDESTSYVAWVIRPDDTGTWRVFIKKFNP